MKLWELPCEPAEFDDRYPTQAGDGGCSVTFALLHGTQPITCSINSTSVVISADKLICKNYTLDYLDDEHQNRIFTFVDHGMKLRELWALHGATEFPRFIQDALHRLALEGDQPLTICGPFETLRRGIRNISNRQVVVSSATPFASWTASIGGSPNHDEDALERILEAYQPHGWQTSQKLNLTLGRYQLKFYGEALRESGHEKAERLVTIEAVIKKGNKPPHVIDKGRTNL